MAGPQTSHYHRDQSNPFLYYDYETGKLIWECGGLGMNAIPAPVYANGIVYAMTGYENPKLMAIRLGGKGDLTESEFVVWSSADWRRPR